jgi:Flp pilus assembly protein TadG
MTRRVRSQSVNDGVRRRDRHDSGLASIELVILLPAFVLLVLLAAYLGRTNVAQSSIDSAAQDAARAASLQRNMTDALAAATQAATATLDAQAIPALKNTTSPSPCVPGTVTATITNTTPTDPFQTPLGTPSRVDVKVSCTVYLANLVFPGLPISGNVAMTSTFSSPIDDYRVRTEPSSAAP